MAYTGYPVPHKDGGVVFLPFTDDATALNQVGSRVVDSFGNVWKYAKFSGTCAAGCALMFADDTSTDAGVYLLKATTGADVPVEALNPIAHTDLHYGWVLYDGISNGETLVVTGDTADGAALASDEDAGYLTTAADANLGPIRCVCIENTGFVKIR